MEKEKPRLFFNDAPEDMEILRYLMNNKSIKSEDIHWIGAVGDAKTPFMEYDRRHYNGIAGIKYFVENILNKTQ